MNQENFAEKIAELLAGTITELVVEKEDFFEFRAVWLVHPNRESIVGEAGLGGKIVYRQKNAE